MIKILNKTRIVRIVSFQTSLRRFLDPRHYTSRPSFQMSDVESRISDIGCRMSNLGCRMSDVRSRMSDVGCWMSDLGCQISDVGCRMSNLGCRMSDVGCRISDGTYKLPYNHELLLFKKCQLKQLLFKIDSAVLASICSKAGQAATQETKRYS